MHALLLQITTLADCQHGAVSIPQLSALGAGRHVISHLVASGQWARVSPMVLRRTGSPPSRRQELMIAVLDTGAGAALSHFAGALLWGANVRSGFPDVMRQRGTTTIPSRFAQCTSHACSLSTIERSSMASRSASRPASRSTSLP